jgi:Rad3-related DNA helicase
MEVDESEIERRVEEAFPAPEFREYQKDATVEVVKGLEEGKEVIQLSAPTGSGKSLILHTAAKAYKELYDEQNPGGGSGMMTNMMGGDAEPDVNWEGDAFLTTPLNSLVDQLEDDEFIGDEILTLKGRNNYNCVHPEDAGTPVDKAVCQRDDGFECEIKDSKCPYYSLKAEAKEEPEVVTNMSYLIAEGMIPASVDGTLGVRDVLEVDECQSIESFAMGSISFTISKRTVPKMVWNNIDVPDKKYQDEMDTHVRWIETQVMSAVDQAIDYYNSQPMKSEDQLGEFEQLRQFSSRVKNFLSDIEDNEWIAKIEEDVNKNAPNTNKIVFKPITIGRFLDNLLWDRGGSIVLSSATIPGGDWLDEIGLGDRTLKKISVPSTFPIENRPIITDHSVGKMTYRKREDNAWPMAKKIKEIAGHHEGQKGFVHCRSYSIAKLLKRAYENHQEGSWFRENVMMQDRYNREESLENWKNSDKQIFFSVAMDEGVDLEGDDCRWQVLAKTLYKSMADRRVEYRLKARHKCDNCGRKEVDWDNNHSKKCPSCGSTTFSGDWDWYNRHAAIQITQAYGRAVRSKEDEAVFYILDNSAIGLIKRSAELFPKWFLEALEDMNVDPDRGM